MELWPLPATVRGMPASSGNDRELVEQRCRMTPASPYDDDGGRWSCLLRSAEVTWHGASARSPPLVVARTLFEGGLMPSRGPHGRGRTGVGVTVVSNDACQLAQSLAQCRVRQRTRGVVAQ
jgi:hypothetical protein